MRTHLKELAWRREKLLAEAVAQRAAVAETAYRLQRSLSSVDRSLTILRYVGRKPLIVAVAVAAVALFFTKPRQAVAWFGYAFTAYEVFQRVRRLLFSPSAN